MDLFGDVGLAFSTPPKASAPPLVPKITPISKIRNSPLLCKPRPSETYYCDSSDSSSCGDGNLNRISWNEFLRFTDVVIVTKTKRRPKQSTSDQKRRKKPKLDDKANRPQEGREIHLEGSEFPSKDKGRQWGERYEELKAHLEANGNRLCQDVWGSPSLARWLSQQRFQHSRGLLSSKRKEMLDQLGIAWDQRQSDWDKKYEELKVYAKTNGNCCFPTTSQVSPPLGRWVSKQRQLNNQGFLLAERKEKLERLGFEWGRGSSRPGEETWQQRYQELEEFVAANGHCLVPTKYKNNPILGQWVARQRKENRDKSLVLDRKNKLQKLGFVRDQDGIWNERFEELNAYKAENGNCLVPGNYKENPGLGKWVSLQRRKKYDYSLRLDRMEMLQNLGFVWDLDHKRRDKGWNQRYEELRAYKAEHGHCLVPRNFKENRALGIWVSSQRWSYRHKLLSEDQKEKLEKLDFVWDFKDEYEVPVIPALPIANT